MTSWKRIAIIALFTGLAHAPVFGIGFEPLSIPKIARHLGIGFGPGYHARPCNPLHATYYDRVTRGAAPFGQSDLRLESFEHTHPYYWPYAVDGSNGCDACNGVRHSVTDSFWSQADRDQETAEPDSVFEADLEGLLPPSQTDDSLPILLPHQQTQPPVSSTPSDTTTLQLPPMRPAHWQLSPARRAPRPTPHAHRPFPDPVWLRNLPDPRTVVAPPDRQGVQPSPRGWISQPSRTPRPPLHSAPRTATRPSYFNWH